MKRVIKERQNFGGRENNILHYKSKAIGMLNGVKCMDCNHHVDDHRWEKSGFGQRIRECKMCDCKQFKNKSKMK